MKKTVFFGLLVILLAFGFIGCDSGNEDDDKEFTVTFDLDGGNIGGNTNSVNIIVKSGKTITDLPVPQKTSYILNGWFTVNNTSLTSFSSSTSVFSDLTVFPNWTLNGLGWDTRLNGSWNNINVGIYTNITFLNGAHESSFDDRDVLWEKGNTNLSNGTFTMESTNIHSNYLDWIFYSIVREIESSLGSDIGYSFEIEDKWYTIEQAFELLEGEFVNGLVETLQEEGFEDYVDDILEFLENFSEGMHASVIDNGTYSIIGNILTLTFENRTRVFTKKE